MYRSTRPRPSLGWTLIVCACLAVFSLACPGKSGPGGGDDVAHGEEEVELAVVMGEIQRHSAKLGYAIQGENRELARFYLEETGEALESVRELESWEGMPIAHPLGVILDPLLPPLERAVDASDWATAGQAYEALIDGCNRCHTATKHGFIVILPAQGDPPYNQRFTPPDDAP